MKGRQGIKKQKNQQIFQQLQDIEYQSSDQQKLPPSQLNLKNLPSNGEQQQQGQILDEQQYSPQIIRDQLQKLQALNKNNQNQCVYQDSSDDDNDRLQQEKKKREQFWKYKHLKGEDVESKKPLTEAELRDVAFAALERSNKRVMVMRKKNQKRMEDLQKIRMAQQPYLTTGNTHFRGSSSQYSIITRDNAGKTFYHPNYSFRVGEMRLENFILKNIKEESTANYLNEVVKFENYAYQQRKKRRHNIE